MEIFGVNVVDIITNPVGILTTAVIGAVGYHGKNIVQSILKPIPYMKDQFKVADEIVDSVVENNGSTLMNKLRNRNLKDDEVEELRQILILRKEKLEYMITRLSRQ